MDGKNAKGQRVSLLNDDNGYSDHHRLKHVGHPQWPHLPLLSLRSAAPSSASTPVLSPSTPDLIRSQSADSVPGQSPSPITPNFHAFPFLLEPRRSGSPHSIASVSSGPHKYKETYLSYLSLSSNQQSHHSVTSDAAPTLLASSSSNSSSIPLSEEQQPPAQSKSSNKKNSYPCPLAKQLGCTDLFTTSGHAARHAKKHTGKKDALCPECNKAFTRKDNMEQHRRTHQNGRSSARSGVSARARSKIRQQEEQKKAASSAAAATARSNCTTPFETNGEIKPTVTPEPGYLASDSATQLLAVRPELRRNGLSSLAPGLETLAIVASGRN